MNQKISLFKTDKCFIHYFEVLTDGTLQVWKKTLVFVKPTRYKKPNIMQSLFSFFFEQSWRRLACFTGFITERMRKNHIQNLLQCLTFSMYFKMYAMLKYAQKHQKEPSELNRTTSWSTNSFTARLDTSEQNENSLQYAIKKHFFCRHHFLQILQ